MIVKMGYMLQKEERRMGGGNVSQDQTSIICIDLKSFYASVECVERGLNPFKTNLVVADPTRSKSTICLAITPAMKSLGIKNRCRIHEIPDCVKYITAMPRMQLYMDYSAKIYGIYLRYVSKEDIHVYSVDECFIDVTNYLQLYHLTAKEMAVKLMQEVMEETGITATAGVGTNLYLAKIAMDIVAKHVDDHIGILDEFSYREQLWDHKPLSDFWRIGSRTEKKLAGYGIHTMGDIAMASLRSEDWLYKMFGIDAELLIDHAWGYAEEDIKAADGVSDDYYKKDELIATIKTDETGIAKLENLPLGKYYVKETGTAYGHVLDGEIRHVDLTYVDQNTPVVVYDKDWQNNRQRVEVSVLKKEKDSDRTLEGAIFGLFAKEDIKSETTGKVLIEADEIIELKSTDEEGKITFVADLPIGATYYVKELYAPDGFVTNDEVKEFTFEYAGEDQPTVTYDFTFDNQPTVVEFTKSSLTTGKELPGCKLKVVDADGNIVDEWTSGKEAHVIRELTVGKEYALVETKPADGYVTAESVKFTIKDTADVQKVEMKDDVTKVKISKQDIAGKELPGAKLTILDQDGKVVESWTSTEKAHYIEMLPIGKYTLREETAPDGYLVAKDVEFEVKDTSEVQHVTMVDEEKPAEKTPEGGKPVSDSPKTGDNTNLWLWFMLLGIGATGTGALAFMRKKKH